MDMSKEESSSGEAVYMAAEDSHVVMSEKVQALAGSIYQEFERMIHKYDEDVVKNLMPLVVNVLECLDLSYTENQEHEVELELLREDNEQLVTQYEREKSLRKAAEQKLLELEDHTDEEIKDQGSKIESLEAILRMLELRGKNSADHVSRLEEKEGEMKKEYAKLHDRYTELFKSHMDYMERTKILMGTDRLENFGPIPLKKSNSNQMTRSAGPVSFGFASFDASPGSVEDYTRVSRIPDTNLGEELSMDEIDHSQIHSSHSDASRNPNQSGREASKSQTRKEERSGNTLYQEFSFQEGESEGDMTGSWVHPGDYASSVGEMNESEVSCDSPTHPNAVNDNFFGMGKEVENLIKENNELLETKNALNIVKDDLIAKVDELTSEQEILREEISSLQALKARMKLRVTELEEEVKRLKEEGEKRGNAKSEDEEDVPLAQRKRFTRVEMARVLMERNQYKERFMELQDAVRWAEMIRATKTSDPTAERRGGAKGGSFMNFFSNLFTAKGTTPGSTTDRLVSSGGMAVHHSPTKSPSSASSSTTNESSRTSRAPEMSAERLQKLQLRRLESTGERGREGKTTIKAHVRRDDGRLQAYGWSLPAKTNNTSLPIGSKDPKDLHPPSGKNLPVPVPIYCRPFMEQLPGMRIFCASGVDLSGGRSRERQLAHNYTSPHTWICTATHSASHVTIIDANRPADILQTFYVCSSHLLCITSVPGAKEDDLPIDAGLLNPSSSSPTGDEAQSEHYSLSFVNVPTTEVKTEPRETEGVVEDEEDEFSECREEPESPKSDHKLSSVLSTMWLGAQNGYIYVHSAIGGWDKCLNSVRLPDSVLSITHISGRVFASLANGCIAIFRRGNDGGWDLSSYSLITMGSEPLHSIRTLAIVKGGVWCGLRNKIHVIDPRTLAISKSFEAHPRKESQVRGIAAWGDGVWVSIRLDSTLRLYHATTHEHLQDVDIEPYVSKMLGTGKLGFSYARITALLVTCSRLWIGTGNGVVISVPLSVSQALPNPLGGRAPGSIVRVAGDLEATGSQIPYCSMSQAQLSFHGHRDAVKFFVAAPGGSGSMNFSNSGEGSEGSCTGAEGDGGEEGRSNSMLVISGGEGYVDFRVAEEGEEGDTASHLIVWKLPQSNQSQNSLLESLSS